MIFDSKLEGWPSGLRRTLGKRVEGNTSPGFESPSLRHVLSCFYKQLVNKQKKSDDSFPLLKKSQQALASRFEIRIND